MYTDGTMRLGLDREPRMTMATDEGVTRPRALLLTVRGAKGEDGGSNGTEGALDGDGVRGGGVVVDEADDVNDGVGDW